MKTKRNEKAMRNMTFEGRRKTVEHQVSGTMPWTEVTTEDYFRHPKGLLFIRQMKRFTWVNGKVSQWVHWLCPELGSGNAGISYWLMIARKQNYKGHWGQSYHNTTKNWY